MIERMVGIFDYIKGMTHDLIFINFLHPSFFLVFVVTNLWVHASPLL